jgi:exodeoxyribonuclease-3
MRLATWNVNSLKARLDRVCTWLTAVRPDVLCLQETKMTDEAFPAATFAELGYASAHHGNGRWNGVAILSKVGLANVRAGFSGELAEEIEQCRILAARCSDVEVVSVYVPNGRAVGSEHYEAKLAWLERLRQDLAPLCESNPNVAVLGDFNVAPEDRDVYDPAQFVGATHVTPAERAALERLEECGLVDVVRQLHPEGPGPFTWWDYRAGAFHKGEGMRIDLVLCSPALAQRATRAEVDREARKPSAGQGAPSDHAPIVVDLAD